MNGTEGLKKFLLLSYEELEKLNLEAKHRAQDTNLSYENVRDHYINYLKEENRIKAVTLCFSDLEGRFHMLDYDKKFLISSYQNLTFDGSSINGFSNVEQSDLKINPDWKSFRWLPGDVFGPGKVIVFGQIMDHDGSYYHSDMRSQLQLYVEELGKKHGYRPNVSVECEGFLLDGVNAEQNYVRQDGFKLVSSGGYFNSLPQDPLRKFIDCFANAQRAMGFENEKDHPEVAPSQFELNYTYCDPVTAGDQLQLYKLLARQIANNMGMTASFLPKPIAGINGNGMHCNISISKDGKNLFFGGEPGALSNLAYDFIDRVLFSANDISLILNSSVNSYRRLDPKFEAPNQIKFSKNDRTSIVRIPMANENSARIEVRTVAPDANPFMVFLSLLKTGLEGPVDDAAENTQKRSRTRFIPDNINDAIRHFKSSEHIQKIIGSDAKDKFVSCKLASAHRCPRALGQNIKESEIWFHHEVTNQLLWSKF